MTHSSPSALDLLRNVPVLISLHAPDGRLLYVNRADAGRDPSRQVGKRPGDFLSPEHAREFMTKLRDVFNTRKPRSLSVLTPDGTGRRRRYKVVLAPHFGPNGKAASVIAAAMDVTAERRGGPRPDAVARLGRLTARQRDVLALLCEGLHLKDVARRLGVGVRTVETHREQLSERLGLRSIAELTRFAVAAGVV